MTNTGDRGAAGGGVPGAPRAARQQRHLWRRLWRGAGGADVSDGAAPALGDDKGHAGRRLRGRPGAPAAPAHLGGLPQPRGGPGSLVRVLLLLLSLVYFSTALSLSFPAPLSWVHVLHTAWHSHAAAWCSHQPVCCWLLILSECMRGPRLVARRTHCHALPPVSPGFHLETLIALTVLFHAATWRRCMA